MLDERVNEIGHGIALGHHRGLDAELLRGFSRHRPDGRHAVECRRSAVLLASIATKFLTAEALANVTASIS